MGGVYLAALSFPCGDSRRPRTGIRLHRKALCKPEQPCKACPWEPRGGTEWFRQRPQGRWGWPCLSGRRSQASRHVHPQLPPWPACYRGRGSRPLRELPRGGRGLAGAEGLTLSRERPDGPSDVLCVRLCRVRALAALGGPLASYPGFPAGRGAARGADGSRPGSQGSAVCSSEPVLAGRVQRAVPLRGA